MNNRNGNGHKRLTPEEFVLLAVEKGRRPKARALHLTGSALPEAFNAYFEGKHEMGGVIQRLTRSGRLVSRMGAKGQVRLYLPQDAPDDRGTRGQALLSKLLAQT